MKRNLGFTLVELMIVVGVIGVLAAIAIPQYDSYVRKSKRADAKVALSSLAQMQESFFANNNRYTSKLGTGGLNCQKKGICNADELTTSPEKDKNYTLSITATANSYTVTATANSASQKKDDRCLTFSIDSRGQKTATNPDCW
jgi:type IV pilus assembly protein PilE